MVFGLRHNLASLNFTACAFCGVGFCFLVLHKILSRSCLGANQYTELQLQEGWRVRTFLAFQASTVPMILEGASKQKTAQGLDSPRFGTTKGLRPGKTPTTAWHCW